MVVIATIMKHSGNSIVELEFRSIQLQW